MTKKKTNKVSKPIGVVFGHKVDDMKESIKVFEDRGLEPVIITWPRYEGDFEGYEVHTQKTPESQGMDCINLVHHSVKLLFEVLDNSVIGAIANNHTRPIIWDWDLTNEEWKELLDFNPNQKTYVDGLIISRYEELYGIKDSDEQDVSGFTE
jgi:hypothetical protein